MDLDASVEWSAVARAASVYGEGKGQTGPAAAVSGPLHRRRGQSGRPKARAAHLACQRQPSPAESEAPKKFVTIELRRSASRRCHASCAWKGQRAGRSIPGSRRKRDAADPNSPGAG